MKPVVKKSALVSIVVVGIAAATAMAAEEAALNWLGTPGITQAEDSEDILVVPGDASESISLLFQWTERDATYNNEAGVYVVDAQGHIDGIAPGEPGYAQAVLNSPRRQVLFSSGQSSGGWQELTFQGGDHLAFYLIQDNTTENWLENNRNNNLEQQPLAFFSVDGNDLSLLLDLCLRF